MEEKIRVAVATLGCKVNQYDSAAIAAALEKEGFITVPFTERADCYIVNTCTVTATTDYQSRQLIRRAARANPEAGVVVTGCYAHLRGDEVARLPGVRLVVSNRDKDAVASLVKELFADGREGARRAVSVPASGDGGRQETIFSPEITSLPGRTRAFLKIQDGCEAACAYCLVPLARGRSRSLPFAEVLGRIARLAEGGYREVVLTGIRLGAYGRDLDPPRRLADLLRAVEEGALVGRLRLSSIEPLELDKDLFALLREAEITCPHLHIPLQSGDDGVLRAMGRGYDASLYRRLAEETAALRPDMTLGTDVIVGLPGEDPFAFDVTLRLIEELPLAYLHVFPYSRRPGTRAAAMAGQVSPAEKKERARILRDLGREKWRRHLSRFLGRPLRVLPEAAKGDALRGRADNYLPVAVRGVGREAVNTFVTVRPYLLAGDELVGRPDRP
ncbi:MAG TPA: tRNA (N(6)-L-threonylcarbamoyladenosine(37)-C(2))-methylthiotransferase MtaB [Syntrophales bacterium]|nr:tRNA (N(6)-L-threonylcarbamoyladenosine(37)-C(2))-methylthiotransferase MtaB [Syntrophales bacterium]HRS86288.1 tRNA (N(6)-L-threonylcarbamoyladenosine(37)-C(2))-methylthiotransferase MtaB [Syntrophales bacterium]